MTSVRVWSKERMPVMASFSIFADLDSQRACTSGVIGMIDCNRGLFTWMAPMSVDA